MALETTPAWVSDLKRKLAQPLTTDERVGLETCAEQIRRLNEGRSWPPGTFQRLLDLADQEDEVRAG